MLDAEISSLLLHIKALLVATEPLYPWSRRIILAFREEIISTQHDTQLVRLLLSTLSASDSVEVKSAAGAFQSTLVASIPVVRIVTEAVASMVQELPKESTSTKPKITLLITEQHNVIARTRDSLVCRFQALWLESWVSVQKLQEQLPTPYASQPQLRLLLGGFNRIPFSVGATNDTFVRGTPSSQTDLLQLEQWQYGIEQASRSWLKNQTRNMESDEFLSAHRTFLNLLWNGSISSLRGIDFQAFKGNEVSIVEEIQSSITLMRDAARDALLRADSPAWSIVFVGAEDAGKSTFINAFIGMDILPVADGPGTAYPCKLRNISGRAEPTLEFGTSYLNDCLEELRRGQWASKIDSLIDDEWDDSIVLPDEYSVAELEKLWTEVLPEELLERLRYFIEPSFHFASPILGEAKIRTVLHEITDFVRICQSLPVGFNRMDPVDWPIVSMEFSGLDGVPLPEGLTLVDIPGVRKSRDADWDEATREIVRTASSVVAMVSLPSLHSSPWRQLPRMIRQGTGVEASMVLLTRTDEVSSGTMRALETHKRLIRSVFWPAFPKRADASHVIITCSALVGPAARSLLKTLEPLPPGNPAPTWDFLTQKQFIGATEYLFGGDEYVAKERLNIESIGSIKSRLDVCLRSFSFEAASGEFKKAVARLRYQSILDYHEGLEMVTRSISFNLRTLMVLVGVAPGMGYIPGSDLERESIMEKMKLLDAWNAQVCAFQEQVHSIVIQAQNRHSNDMEACINKALMSATRNLELTHRSASPLSVSKENNPVLQFGESEDLEKYMDSYRTAFEDIAKVLDIAAAESVLQEAQNAHDTLFKEMEDTLSSPRLVCQADLTAVLPPRLVHFNSEDLFPHVDEIRTRYTITGAFSQTQLRVLKVLTLKDDFQRLRHLGAVSRFLLSIASTIPFILTLPYWLNKSYVQAYTLSLQSLRPVLIQEAKLESTKFFDILESQLVADALRQTQTVGKEFPPAPHRGSVSMSIDGIQRLIAMSANIIALSTTAEAMQTAVSKK
ncbi:hypothetical protein M408DRAFT_329631 [Serendipita vermifera MAFF 305830]|uniref:Dynamin N-terminal domain-containing protein n=1 Tax=Serendipita vermifera MAFF 305830 TaxID=933852 RepID=A0A0C2XFU8_SERVB|nr:hypothetical protein M408DRAFT_329631 [Serendipita vermifera MAFF 305830]